MPQFPYCDPGTAVPSVGLLCAHVYPTCEGVSGVLAECCRGAGSVTIVGTLRALLHLSQGPQKQGGHVIRSEVCKRFEEAKHGSKERSDGLRAT